MNNLSEYLEKRLSTKTIKEIEREYSWDLRFYEHLLENQDKNYFTKFNSYYESFIESLSTKELIEFYEFYIEKILEELNK